MTPLSPRMEEVASLVAEGLSNKAIAKRMGVTYGTVRQYLVRIAQRLPGEGPARWRIMAYYIREHDRAA